MRGEHQDFFDWTDMARAAAAVLVVFGHARDVLMVDYPGQRLWLPFYAGTSLGHAGVTAFFVLSGFWISGSVLRRIDDSAFWPGYLIDRLSRLAVVLVPALLLGGLLDTIGCFLLHLPVYQGLTGAHTLQQNVPAALTLPVFLGNLAFFQTILVPPWGSNGPLWSLACEFWYYMWFPALARTIVHRRPSLMLLTLLVGVANPSFYWGFLSWLIGWLLLSRLKIGRVRPVARGWAALAAGSFCAILFATGLIGRGWTDLSVAISFGLLLLALVRCAVPFPRVLAPIARYGSGASFSLYAIHYPIMALVGGIITGRARFAPGVWSLLLTVTLTAFCVLAGWLFSRGTEALTPRLRDWLRLRLLSRAVRSGA